MRASWWFIKRIKIASIVQATVPTTSPPPFSPGWVIAILTIGISRFPRRTIDALGGVYALGHCGHRCQGQSYGNAKKCEFHDASLQSCFTIAFPQAAESIPVRCCGHCRPCCRRARFSAVHPGKAPEEVFGMPNVDEVWRLALRFQEYDGLFAHRAYVIRRERDGQGATSS
jgi:hypothetical protein